MTNTKKIIYITIGVLMAAALGVVLFYYGGGKVGKVLQYVAKPEEKPKIITEENLVIPETQKISSSDGRLVEKGSIDVPLVPKSEGEKVIVSKAVLTVKGSINLAVSEAKKWSDDSKLVFVKSLGAVDLEGKSSQWQLIFSAKTKKGNGYEVIIQADKIVSQKEIATNKIGADVPVGIKDSGDAIKMLQELPQFSSATVSSVQLYYSADGKAWFYSFATSLGATSGPAL